ncbi:hypothetical protein [Nocardia sp. NPDC049707]|uniref:hypothetical protein n=1 Tax=Nocardia sp. NPDC049707 TaxID=3154735 RepID=UPI0034204255
MNLASANSGWRARSGGPRNFGLRAGALSDAQRRELLLRGVIGSATILGVRQSSMASFARPFVRAYALPSAVSAAPRGASRPDTNVAGRSGPGHVFWVRVQVEGVLPYETRVRQRMREDDLEWMQPGDVIGCRVDPGDRDRVVLYVPDIADTGRMSISKILSDGRRADATVLAATPVATDYAGRDDPVLRLDLELRAWDEVKPWRVRLIQPVPLAAIGLVDLGQHLEVAFFTVDRGESVAVDWLASLGEE